MAGKREEQMKEITERLEQGVQELFTSEKYMEYLKTMSQFHNYSFNNTLLIAMQKPEATLVAGFGAWQKKFNRQVKRGEKGIKIIAPAPIRRKEEIEKFDPETNEPILRPDGQPETEEVEHIIPRFRIATVFDISQTYGDPLPELDTPELMGSVENFPVFMEAIENVSPVPMRYAEIEGESKGYYSNTEKEIVIQDGMSEKQTMKTAVHEVTHAMCHDRDIMAELGEKKNRMTKEVEAESVAYTVCSYFGLDTSDYSFPYIAGWSSDMDMKELRSSMEFIRKTAGSFIDSMVEHMQKLQKEKETEIQPENIPEDGISQEQEEMIPESGISHEQEAEEMSKESEEYQEVEIFESPALFSNGRIAENDVPEGFYRYDLRGSDDDPGDPIAVENHVTINHAGAILTTQPLPIPERGFLNLGEGLNFIGGMPTPEQFRQYLTGVDSARLEEIMQDAVIYSNEELLYTDTTDRYAIFQIDENGKGKEYLFFNMEFIQKKGMKVEGRDYSLVYGGRLGQQENLDTIYEKFNLNHPEGYAGHSLSVSDIVVLNRGGHVTAHFVDSFGFTELPDFVSQRERLIGKEAEQDLGEETYPPLYTHTLSYAMEHGRVDDCLESRKLNLDCKKAVEAAIRENFDGMHLAHDAAEPVLEEYGAERVTFILANTVQYLEYDGRISRDNKEWAKGFEIPENISRGMDLNTDYIVNSHPAVLDGFIGLAREKMQEKNLRRETETQISGETRGFAVDGHFGTWHTAEVQEINDEQFYRMEHDEYGDSVASIIVNQDGKLVAEDLEYGFDQGAREAIHEYFMEKGIDDEWKAPFIAQYYVIPDMHEESSERESQYFSDFDAAVDAYHQIPNHKDKQIGMESTEQPPSRMPLIECRNGIETLNDIEFSSLSGKWVREEMIEASQKAKDYLENHDIELAYEIERGYFFIQTVSDGYDYTVYNKNFREINGGVYDNPDIPIHEAMDKILVDEGISAVKRKVMDHQELQERVDAVAQEDLQKAQKNFQETQEDKQKAQKKEPEKMTLISDRTEPETALNGRSCADIEETVLCYTQAQIDEMGLADDVKLLGARVYRSRSKEGLYHEGSDIDVVVSYSGDFKENAFFNVLHEEGLTIAGIPVDINPISTEKTGTLEEYLERADKYLNEKQREIETIETNLQPEPEPTITFYVAECSEFHVLGEYHEHLETLQEAMELYEKIPAERMNGIKEIGFCLEDGSIYDGMPQSLMVAGEVQTEFINEISHFRNSPLVQKTIEDMEMILSQRAGQYRQNPAERASKMSRNVSGGNKKQSVLNALRERQARLKAQEKQGQRSQVHKKGEQEL